MISLYKHFLKYFIRLAITILCFSGMSQIWATLLKPTFISLPHSLYSKCWAFFFGGCYFVWCIIFLFNWVFMYVGMFYFVQIFYCFTVSVFLCVYSIYISFIWELGFWAVCGFSYCFCIGLWALCFLVLIVVGMWCLWGCVWFRILGFVQNGEFGCIENEWRNQVFCIYALL